MAIAPGVTSTSVLDPQGLANQLADLRRLIGSGTSSQTIIGVGSIDGGAKIASGSIVTGNIQAGAIDATLIAANAITAGAIAANSISATHLQANSVTAGKIAADAVVAGNIAAGAVQAGEIAAGAVSATNISSINLTTIQAAVTTLSAITSNLGSITAGTIQGATIQTASSGSRVVIDSAGLRGFASDGVTKVFEIATGTGIATFVGTATITGGSIVPSAIPTIGGGNLLNDSSFEDASAGAAVVSSNWFLYNNNLTPAPTLDRFVVTGAKSGSAVARLTNGTDTIGNMGILTNTAARPTVEAGKDYTLSVYGQPAASGGQFQVHIHWYNSSDVLIGSGSPSVNFNGVSNQWTRASVTATAPVGAVKAACYAWVNSPASGFVFYFDAMQFEEGLVPTAYQAKITELLPGAIQTVHLAAGAVTANVIAAGAVTAQKLSLKFQSANMLPNARFSYWTASLSDPGMTQLDTPGYWQHYDNGGTGTATWSKVTAGGPTGENSWRLVTSTTTATKGFMTQGVIRHALGITYTVSLWWKGNAYPYAASNSGFTFAWVGTPPTPSTTVWQQYVFNFTPTVEGTRLADGTVGAPGGYDFFYIYPSSNTTGAFQATADVQIAKPQREQGDYNTPFAPKTDELLPYSVGNTTLSPDSVTTDKILASTIQAGDIGASQINATHISAINLSVIQAAVTTLSAITANMGTITAGTITGATMQTATSDPKVILDSAGLRVSDASSNVLMSLKADGTGMMFLAAEQLNYYAVPNSQRIRFATAADEPMLDLFGYTINSPPGTLHKEGLSLVTTPLASSYVDAKNIVRAEKAISGITRYADLKVTATSTDADIAVQASGVGGNSIRTVFNSDQESHFMQAVSLKTNRWNFGVSSVNSGLLNAGAVTGVNITHSLGATPTHCFAQVRDGGSLATGMVVEGIIARTSTTFQIALRNNTGAAVNGTVSISWMAST